MNLLARVDAKFQMDLVILQGPCGDPIRTFCPNHLPTLGFSCGQEVARGPKPTLQANAMPHCIFPVSAVHGQRSIPTGGMAAVRDEAVIEGVLYPPSGPRGLTP